MGAVTQSWCRIGIVSNRSPSAAPSSSLHGPTATTTVSHAIGPVAVSTPVTRPTRPRSIVIAVAGVWVRILTPSRRAARANAIASV